MKSFVPNGLKLIIPVMLLILSVEPEGFVRQGMFGKLMQPFHFLTHPPFSAEGHPGFLTIYGAMTTAGIWGLIIYLMCSVCEACGLGRRSKVRAHDAEESGKSRPTAADYLTSEIPQLGGSEEGGVGRRKAR